MDVAPKALGWSAATCTLAFILLMSSGRSAAVLQCLFCPLQARGSGCSNMSTECAPHERCFSGWRRYGRVHVLSMQGCAPSQICGSNQTLTLMGSEYEISYMCCCRDLCNTSQGHYLRQLIGVTVNTESGHCPED